MGSSHQYHPAHYGCCLAKMVFCTVLSVQEHTSSSQGGMCTDTGSFSPFPKGLAKEPIGILL